MHACVSIWTSNKFSNYLFISWQMAISLGLTVIRNEFKLTTVSRQFWCARITNAKARACCKKRPIKKPHRPSQKGLADVVFCVRIKLSWKTLKRKLSIPQLSEIINWFLYWTVKLNCQRMHPSEWPAPSLRNWTTGNCTQRILPEEENRSPTREWYSR